MTCISATSATLPSRFLDKVICGDALKVLSRIPDASVDMILTSPPYWALRDYDNSPNVWGGSLGCKHAWDEPGQSLHRGQVEQTIWKNAKASGKAGNAGSGQFCAKCGAWRGCLGLEPTPDLYVSHLVRVFDEVRRVLKPIGTCWINLADTYRSAQGPRCRVPEKSLCLIPARFALAMIGRGWILRNDAVWHKMNSMPTSVKDRLRCSWEHLFFFVKSPRYYFDLDVIREPHTSLRRAPKGARRVKTAAAHRATGFRPAPEPGEPHAFHPLGKNPGDFWSIPAETRSLGAITGTRGAVKVPGGAGWLGHPPGGEARILRERDPRWLSPKGKNPGDAWSIPTHPFREAHFAVFPEKLCVRPILAGCPPGGVVLDPFAGSGTVGVVAKRLERRFVLIDRNRDYCRMARKRLVNAAVSGFDRGI